MGILLGHASKHFVFPLDCFQYVFRSDHTSS
jgi:hypothetical protein